MIYDYIYYSMFVVSNWCVLLLWFLNLNLCFLRYFCNVGIFNVFSVFWFDIIMFDLFYFCDSIMFLVIIYFLFRLLML